MRTGVDLLDDGWAEEEAKDGAKEKQSPFEPLKVRLTRYRRGVGTEKGGQAVGRRADKHLSTFVEWYIPPGSR